MFNLREGQMFGLTMCLGGAGLQLGTTSDLGVDTVTLNTDGLEYCINGKQYLLADTDSLTFTDGLTVPTLKVANILLSLNSAGTCTGTLGTPVLIADLAAGTAVLDYPPCPADNCVIGCLRVSNASAASWVSGTDELDATDVTTTYQDLITVPDGPETS